MLELMFASLAVEVNTGIKRKVCCCRSFSKGNEVFLLNITDEKTLLHRLMF